MTGVPTARCGKVIDMTKILVTNVLLVATALVAAILSIRGQTYVDSHFTPIGGWAIFFAVIAFVLGITKEVLTQREQAAKDDAAARAAQSAEKKIGGLEAQLQDATGQRDELKTSLKKANERILEIETPRTAFVPFNDLGHQTSFINGIEWIRYCVHEGYPIEGNGPELQLNGGETIRYTVGVSRRQPDQSLLETEAYLLIGAWRYPLRGAGQIQVLPSRDGDPAMGVYVEIPGERNDWDVALKIMTSGRW